jgi:glycosyltransferase involved in cell wall biosynthesis
MAEEEMQSTPLVSIIVAFYNIESCVRYCMDSLTAQTFDDCEIICVDDGSTDGTGQLLGQYSSDPRVRIVHKPNGGLSDARNYGVSISMGRYITFVDGDDIIAPHYLSSLVNAMEGRDNRMVISLEVSMPYSATSDPEKVVWSTQGEPLQLNRQQVVEEILYDRIHPGADAKLAPREVYLNHPFPVGCLYEEIRTIMTFVRALEEFVIIPSTIYGYIMRDGSITWSKSISVNRLEQYQTAAETITNDALDICPGLQEAAQYQKALLYTRMHSQLPVGVVLPQDVKEKDDEIRGTLKSLIPQVKKNKAVPLASKWRMQLLVSAPYLYDELYTLYRKKIKGVQ